MIYIILLLIGWFFLSQRIADWFLQDAENEDLILTVRAAMFMAPAMIGLMVLTWLSWKTYARLFELNESLPIHFALPIPSEHWVDEL